MIPGLCSDPEPPILGQWQEEEDGEGLHGMGRVSSGVQDGQKDRQGSGGLSRDSLPRAEE